MVKRFILLLLALALVLPAGNSLAELNLNDTTPARKMLKTYMENVNTFLQENGELPVNRVFDQTDYIVEMGITLMEDAYIPEGVTVTVHLYYDQLWYMLLRVDGAHMDHFPQIASAFVRALNPRTMTQEEALKTPAQRLQKAYKSPNTSFEDYEYDIYEDRETSILNGERPQTYYAYYPNQYKEDPRVDWMEMMVVFPLSSSWDAERGVITQASEIKSYQDENREAEDFDWYFSEDNYRHSEVFATPTPEPDSAAAEYGNLFTQ